MCSRSRSPESGEKGEDPPHRIADLITVGVLLTMLKGTRMGIGGVEALLKKTVTAVAPSSNLDFCGGPGNLVIYDSDPALLTSSPTRTRH
ncbi:hypothetical protein Pyn_01712 [Prunus yedoensis var. nudiflora]|uniref:Uncharacterized protein n=1 Tax=Prunus yedoensis var. nudiflora TaxID=2094558 RepID=A0A314XZT5_PRUYE|nr:hypothetical protein Pyn_01712 [Prunus yedoensis var. nudiflora]